MDRVNVKEESSVTTNMRWREQEGFRSENTEEELMQKKEKKSGRLEKGQTNEMAKVTDMLRRNSKRME